MPSSVRSQRKWRRHDATNSSRNSRRQKKLDAIWSRSASRAQHWFAPAHQRPYQAWRLSATGERHLPATRSCLRPSAAPAIARATLRLRHAKPRCVPLSIEPDSQLSRLAATIGSMSPKPRVFGAYQPLQNCTASFVLHADERALLIRPPAAALAPPVQPLRQVIMKNQLHIEAKLHDTAVSSVRQRADLKAILGKP